MQFLVMGRIANKWTFQGTNHAAESFPLSLPPRCVLVCICVYLAGRPSFCLVSALDIPKRQPCLQYVLAQWPCFCLLERYNSSQNLKQKGELVVWTPSDLFFAAVYKTSHKH